MTIRYKQIRAHPDFADLVDEWSKAISKQLGIEQTEGIRNRKISSRVVTKKIAERLKRNRIIEL